MTKTSFDVGTIGNQSSKTILITGSTSGIGFETAKVLAHHGAHVVITGRHIDEAQEAAKRIRFMTSNQHIEVMQLDLASLKSIREFANTFLLSHHKLDILINNAGVLIPPYRQTQDGFEPHFGINYLGHFALTGLLLDLILTTPHSRILSISSVTHYLGRFNLDDIKTNKPCFAGMAYARSKLAILMFIYELQRRLTAAKAETIAIAAHPGWAKTDIERNIKKKWIRLFSSLAGKIFSQSAEQGSLPMLKAATDANVQSGEYYGPSGFLELKGDPVLVKSSKSSYDVQAQSQLWQLSEKLTEIRYAI